MPARTETERFRKFVEIVLAALIIGLAPAGAQKGPQAAASQPLVIASQGSFFVGGELKHAVIDGNKTGPFGFSTEDDIIVGQMYVQYQIPQNHGTRVPIVLIHGCCLSGKTWETTPDGRMGWSEYFLRRGRPVYVPDQTSRGRSGFDATRVNQARAGVAEASSVPRIFTFGRSIAWKVFRFGPEYPNAFPDLQFPVSQFEELAKQVIPDLNGVLPNPNPTFANLATLARQLNGAILVGHSESGYFPERAALVNPEGIRGIVSIEPLCPDSVTAQEVAVLAKVPIVFVWGDHLEDSPVPLWKTVAANCERVAKLLTQGGGDATVLHLPQAGLKGNSHMLMQDLNNLKVADLILDWIAKHAEKRR
jgi:pimeloyl-ACP methyl ester carboxylesterase